MATEKAKLIASAVRGGTVFVYAASSKDPVLAADNAYKTLNKMETSSFECSDCGNKQHVVSSVSPEPYCVTCGSDRVIQSNRRIPETAAFTSDSELSSVTCGACDTENVMPIKAVRAAKGCMHCVVCGGDLDVAEGEGGKEESDFAPQPEVTPSGGGSSDFEGEDDFPSEETSEVEDGDDESFTEESDALDSLEMDNGSEDPTMGLPEPDFGAEATDDSLPNFGDLSGIEEPGNEEQLFLDDATDVSNPAAGGEPLIDAMELNDTPEGLEFMSKAGTLLAMKGAHVVAFARAADVGQNADILHSPEFAKAVVMTASRLGARKALARMGFKNIRVKPTDVKASNRAIAVAKSEFATTARKKEEVFADCLAIAAAGLAKGLFKNFKDPIRAAVELQLQSSMNVRASKVMASRIMSENGMEYAKSLIMLANKLSGMTAQTRKEYADMLDLIDDGTELALTASADEMPENDYSEQTSGVDDGEDVTDASEDLDSVQSRLTTAALLMPSNRLATGGNGRRVSASASASAILAGTAPLSFGV